MESLIFLPMMMTTPTGNLPQVSNIIDRIPQIVLSQKENTVADDSSTFNQVEEDEAKILDAQAKAIDAYYKKYDMPLYGMGMKMAIEARKNDIDYRLIPAISVIESTGNINGCKKATHSFLGWGSCKINFKSDAEAIEIVAHNLGGNNPNTARHYANKNTKEILLKYNPPSIVPDYAPRVMKVMDSIGDEVIVNQNPIPLVALK